MFTQYLSKCIPSIPFEQFLMAHTLPIMEVYTCSVVLLKVLLVECAAR